MSSSVANSSQSSLELLESLKRQLMEAPPPKQLLLLPQLMETGIDGYQVLMDFLLEAKAQAAPSITAGRSLQLLHQADTPDIKTFLDAHFAEGLVSLPDACSVDYANIQTALVHSDFELADRLTLQKMCELAGENAAQRKWLYFTEVNNFPTIDLQTLNVLWLTYSAGKFGFSKQREIWLGIGRDWEKLWPKIGWKDANVWTRYPKGFIWSLEAPAGHLPLTNQLRGVRVMDALMNHPAWETKV